MPRTALEWPDFAKIAASALPIDMPHTEGILPVSNPSPPSLRGKPLPEQRQGAVGTAPRDKHVLAPEHGKRVSETRVLRVRDDRLHSTPLLG